MARTAHRTVIISVAFALASWALVAGGPVLAATMAEQAGPSLPPAEYKPLPVGTKVTYDTWGYTVTKSDGYGIRFKTDAGNWKKYYAVFGKYGDAAYTPRGERWRTTLDAENKAALENIWPLKVGKKAQWNLEELTTILSATSRPGMRPWTVTVEVVGTEVLELNGFLYPTYVVKEHVVSEGAVIPAMAPDDPPMEYTETRWYNPESGLVLRSVKDWTRGPKKGEQEDYSLVRVRFPRGTKTNVLAGTKVPSEADARLLAEIARLKQEVEGQAGTAASERLLAEIARLKRDAEAKGKALEQARGRESEELREQREEQKRLMEQVARLTQEAGVKQKALEAVKGSRSEEVRRQREEQKRLSAQVARLMREAEERRKAEAQPPQAALEAKLAKYRDIEFGRYHALVIGIGNYKHLTRLMTAVNDAKAVADVLRQDYGFTVKLLLDPARGDIVDTLDEYRAALGKADNLLIYYAGHGWLDKDSNRGYWLAADARPKRRSNWVSNATITDTLKTLQAKHVMVVADSCYSGTLIRGASVGLRSGDYWKRMAQKRTRVALTSGGLEPVVDIDGGDHSPFATAFIGALKRNDAVMDGTTLFNEVRRPVMLSANQTPEYSDVRNAGHDGGDFLFVRRR